MQDKYDIVIIDCPPNTGPFTSNAVVASDYVITPMTINSLSLQGFKYTLDFVESAQLMNPNLKFLGVVMNLADKRYAAHKAIIDLVNSRYSEYVICPPFSRRAVYQRVLETGQNIFKEIIANDAPVRQKIISKLYIQCI